ncbi:hypothetical protein [Xanthomarina gelatinilytica]|uniref:hypothetical protein n=1 Tax=Xanthomarina gelatinilytica TaxID=1137281 RepID=UPI003AA98396
MSKYLIRTTASIYLDPIDGVNQLKKDLLLYDCLGMLNLETLLQGLDQYKKYPFYRDALNNLIFLVDNKKFIELKSLIKPGDVMMDETDMKLANLTMDLKTQGTQISPDDEEKRNEIFWKLDELDTRLWCNIANTTNEEIYVVPSLKDTNSFELKETTKQKAYSIIHGLIPLPVDNTPWEKILDFNNDKDSRLKLSALKNWINDLPEDIRKDELNDKVHHLLNEYKESLRRHKISSRVSIFKTVVNSVPTAISELLRLRFDKALNGFFQIAEQQVNFQKYDKREKLKGSELAFISLVEKKFKNKNYR